MLERRRSGTRLRPLVRVSRALAAGVVVAGAWGAGSVRAASEHGSRQESDPGTGGASLPAERAEAIDRFVGGFVELAMFDGTILVEVSGRTVYRRSFGLADYELAVPHRENTRFRIASVSKTLTDAAVAVLMQRGVLTRATPLAAYLPGFPSADEITVGHLLEHSSGIPHTNDQPWGDGRTSLALDEIVERLAALPLDFAPGTDSSYSNGGYAVLAKVLETATGEPFAKAMDDLLFAPLGMEDTGHIQDAREIIPGIATGYEPGPFPGERRHPRFYAVETRPGGGSLYSTASDLLAFARAVFREGFLEPRLVRDVLGADDGAFLSQGRSPGFVAKLYRDPARDLIVVSLSNNYAVPADWAAAIATLASGGRLEGWPRLAPADPKVAADDLRIGRYRSSFSGGSLTIARGERGGLVIDDTENDSKTGLIPLANRAFLMPLYFQRCEQDRETRVITCRMLSGNPLYTSELTPLAD